MKEVPLRRVARVVNGGTPTPDPDNWDGNVPWATPVDLGRSHGQSIEETVRSLSRTGLQTGSAEVPMGSVILSTRAPVGYVARNSVPMAFNQGCKGIVPAKELDAAFLSYVLQSRREFLAAVSTGTTFLELSTGSLLGAPIPLPTLDQQRAIADFLDRETAQIDAMIEAQEGLLAALEERRNAARRRAIFPLRSQVDERPLKQLATRVAGSAFPLEEQGLQGMDLDFYKVAVLGQRSSMGVISAECDSITTNTAKALGARVVAEGSSLMAKIGAASLLGRVGLNSKPCCVDNNMVAFTPRLGVTSRFLYHLLSDIDIYPYINQSTIPYMNERALLSSPMPLPSLEVQHRLVDDLDAQLERGAAMVLATQRTIEHMRERREALITAAVTGRIDPDTGIERIDPTTAKEAS